MSTITVIRNTVDEIPAFTHAGYRTRRHIFISKTPQSTAAAEEVMVTGQDASVEDECENHRQPVAGTARNPPTRRSGRRVDRDDETRPRTTQTSAPGTLCAAQ